MMMAKVMTMMMAMMMTKVGGMVDWNLVGGQDEGERNEKSFA